MLKPATELHFRPPAFRTSGAQSADLVLPAWLRNAVAAVGWRIPRSLLGGHY